MMRHLPPRQFTRIAAVGLVALMVVLTIVRSRHSEQAVVLAPSEHIDALPLNQEVARCRTVTADELTALENCRRVWGENRRQFFGAGRAPQSPTDPVLKAPVAPVKNEDRVMPRDVDPRQGEAH
jgi:conjugative transfer region protein TrbK